MSAAALAIAAGASQQQAITSEAGLYQGGQSTAVLDGLIAAGDSHGERSIGLGVVAASLGAGSVVPWVVGVMLGAPPPVAVAVVPTADGGLALSLGGRW